MANGTIAFDTLSTSGQISGTAVSVDTDYLAYGSAKVWYDTSADGTTINDSFNVTSMADTATGRQTITIASDMGSANYAVEVQVSGNLARFRLVQSEAAGSVETGVYAADSSAYTDGGQHVTIHGDLA